jgi:hypothetical protein
MSQTIAPSQADILKGLEWLRSDDPEARARGIEVLCNVRDDPRIFKVFEHLYEHDPDLRVRQVAWHALKGTEPSVPAPVPKPEPAPELDSAAEAVVAAPVAEAVTPPAADPPAAPAQPVAHPANELFLLKPSHEAVVVRLQNTKRRKRSGLGLLVLAIVIALVAVVLALGVVPDLVDDYRLDQSGITVEGSITALSVVGDDYRVFYQFDTAHELEATTRHDDRPVTEVAYNDLSVDDRVLITYWPEDPALSRIDAPDPADIQRNRQLIAAAALGVLALLALGLSLNRRSAARRWRVVKGQIVACKVAVEGKQYTVCVRYRVKSPESGKSLDGKTCRVRNDLRDTTLPAAGTPVAVHYRHDRVHHML